VTVLALLKQIVSWISPAFRDAGYAVIVGAVLMERSIFIGLIVPGDVILLLGGLYAQRGELDLAWVIVAGTLSAVAGESIGYWLGRRFGLGLVRRLPFGEAIERRLQGAREYFERRGGWTVALGRYATAAGAFIPFIAGAGRMPYRRFLLFDIPAIAIWAAGITVLGYFFGSELDTIERALSRFGWIAFGLLVAFIAWRAWRSRRTRRRA
jgi:undecaprenyl-diphosphatase